MIKRFRIGLLLIVTFLVADCLAAEETQSDVAGKKYKLSICALFKNEARHLKEWIEYHRLVGVDHFYLYDNGSHDRCRDLLKSYINQGIVTWIHWPDRIVEKEGEVFKWVLSTQISAYENAAKFRAINETEWLTILDVSEFLVPPTVDKLTDILDRHHEHSGVILVSDFFDGSITDRLPPRRLIIEASERTKAPEQDLQKTISKMIFKPQQCKGFVWPPYQCVFKNNEPAVAVSRSDLRINHYAYRNRTYPNVGAMKNREFAESSLFPENETVALLEQGYQIEDPERAIFRFVPELLKRMGYVSGWGW